MLIGLSSYKKQLLNYYTDAAQAPVFCYTQSPNCVGESTVSPDEGHCCFDIQGFSYSIPGVAEDGMICTCASIVHANITFTSFSNV